MSSLAFQSSSSRPLTVLPKPAAAAFDRGLADTAGLDLHGQAVGAAFAEAILKFKSRAQEADALALKQGGQVPEAVADELVAMFHQLADMLHHHLGDRSSLPAPQRRDLGHRLQRELLPYLHAAELGDRMYAKPRGYAGDFLTIDMCYRETPTGWGRLGAIMDRAIREQPGCKAVVNRRQLLAEEIQAAIQAAAGRPCQVSSLACGPAAELFDAMAQLRPGESLAATCIDIDEQALAFVADRCARTGLQESFELHQGNLVHLALGRRKLDLAPQDLMYSIGLIDYFEDKFVIRLLNWIHSCLRPGGRVILGNFHPDNPTKALIDHILDWPLIHRDQADMDRLMAASHFGRACTRIRFEAEGVNMFAEGVKA